MAERAQHATEISWLPGFDGWRRTGRDRWCLVHGVQTRFSSSFTNADEISAAGVRRGLATNLAHQIGSSHSAALCVAKAFPLSSQTLKCEGYSSIFHVTKLSANMLNRSRQQCDSKITEGYGSTNFEWRYRNQMCGGVSLDYERVQTRLGRLYLVGDALTTVGIVNAQKLQ